MNLIRHQSVIKDYKAAAYRVYDTYVTAFSRTVVGPEGFSCYVRAKSAPHPWWRFGGDLNFNIYTNTNSATSKARLGVIIWAHKTHFSLN